MKKMEHVICKAIDENLDELIANCQRCKNADACDEKTLYCKSIIDAAIKDCAFMVPFPMEDVG